MIAQALTLAGSDSGGGAGIQADLKTFQALGVYGTSVITSVTAQNSAGIAQAFDLPIPLIESQLRAVLDDFSVGAAKTGMLGNAQTIGAVSKILQEKKLKNVVVDPVMVSSSGFKLLEENSIEVLKKALLPLALLVTPNFSEAEVLSGLHIDSLAKMEEAAKAIHRLGPLVLIKGGHAPFRQGSDLFWDGTKFQWIEGEYIEGKKIHGAGCTYSAAITANLALGKSLHLAIEDAKKYTENAIHSSLSVGRGLESLNHFSL